MKNLCFLCVFLFTSCAFSGQHSDYRMDLWKSEVKDKQFRLVGNDGENLVFIKNGASDDTKVLYMFDEATNKFVQTNTKIKSNSGKIVDIFSSGKLTVMTGYYSLPKRYKKLPIDSCYGANLEFQNLWIQKDNETYLLDTFSGLYADMFFHLFISTDKRYVFCSKFDLDGEPSGLFLYDLYHIQQKGETQRKELNCARCKNSGLFGDSIIYNKEIVYGPFGGDFFRFIYCSF